MITVHHGIINGKLQKRDRDRQCFKEIERMKDEEKSKDEDKYQDEKEIIC